IMELYGQEYLRKSTQTNIEKLYGYHEEKLRVSGTCPLRSSKEEKSLSASLPVLRKNQVTSPFFIDLGGKGTVHPMDHGLNGHCLKGLCP
ncbi:hypothetical protein Tco_0711121, partial [Tanacetum coccineum]